MVVLYLNIFLHATVQIYCQRGSSLHDSTTQTQ